MSVLSRKRLTVMAWTCAFAHVALFALAFPPFDLWFLALLAPIPLVLLAFNALNTRTALIATFIAQFVLWMWLVRWIVPVTAVGYPFLALYMSIWPTVFVWIVKRINARQPFNPWRTIVGVPVVWVGVEFFRGDVLFNGYPWYLLGHPFIEQPILAQSADMFGTYFISFLAAMAAGSIVVLCQVRRNTPLPFPAVQLLFVALVFIANIGYGMWRMRQTVSLTPGPRILAIQTNLPQSNKIEWSEAQKELDVKGFIAITVQAVQETNPKPDLVIWPETMVPGTGFESATIAKLREMNDVHGWNLSHLYRWPLALQSFQRELNIPMIVGSEAWINPIDTLQGNKIRIEPQFTYNSAFLIDSDSPLQRYDKYFLTPFGETMPYISEWPWLESLFLRIGVGADLSFNLDSNPDIVLLRLERTQDRGATRLSGEVNDKQRALIATPICFEDTVARFCRRMIYREGEKQGDLFINISNDGWFGLSHGDRKLHAQIARFRCIENRVPMVRSVNTGLSVWIDSCGRIKSAAIGDGYGKPWQTGWVLAETQLDARRSLYGRIGEVWPIVCMAITVLLLGRSFYTLRVDPGNV